MDRKAGMPPPAPRSAKSSKTSVSSSIKGSVSSFYSVSDTQGNKSKGSQKGRKGRSSRIFYFWTCEDVNKWLKKHHVHYHQLYGDCFREHDITGRTLVRLTDNKLENIGISDPQHREDLLRHILKLKLRVETQELKNMTHRGLSGDQSNNK